MEKIEKAKNAQLAREIEVSIPKKLKFREGYNLVNEFSNRNFVDKGMIADICFHDKGDGNPHAHIMLTVRPFNEDRSWGSKQKKAYILDENGEKIYDKKKRQYKCKSVPTTDWNDRGNAPKWRKSWAELCNKYLEKSGHDERIDYRSYEMVINAKKEKKKRKEQAGEALREVKMELYQIDRQLRDLPQFYKMYSMYEMEECIENEERYGEMISRLEKMADRIETNQAIAYLEYDIVKDKVEPEDAEAVSEERYKIRPEMNKQARVELTDIYGKEFDGELFDVTMEEMDELLEGKVAARAEKEKNEEDIMNLSNVYVK